MNYLRVIIAGGGTGGHIFPAVAIAHALQRLLPGTQLLFVGALGKMEMEKVPKEGFEIIGLDIAGFNRSHPLRNITLPYKLLKSRIQARKIIKKFNPSVVVGVGGYASFPMLNAAQGMNIPTLIQEQNSFAGRSNKILGRKARAICVAYPNMERFFPAAKVVLTGNPVRKDISTMNNIEKVAAMNNFGLVATAKTILVVGGSLGAKSINESIDKGLEELMKGNVQLLWQTGKHYFDHARKRANSFGGRVVVADFISNMADAYTVADVVVSRAGALASAELCIAAKPVIFIPYPFASEDHQTSNAIALVQQNGAIIVRDSDAITQLIPRLIGLLNDHQKMKEMAKNLAKMAIFDADERIAKKVIELGAY